MAHLSRRTLIKAAGMAGVSVLPADLSIDLGQSQAAAQNAEVHHLPDGAPRSVSQPQPQPTTYLFFNSEEASFVEAAVARLIPADDQWPGALEAGVPNFIDKQLNGAWGSGERLYRSGPWQRGTPSQGYQLPLTPAELFRTAIAAVDAELKATGVPFAKMSAEQQDAYLHSLESGGRDLSGVPSGVFFTELWECTLEGFFGDPVYGGNRDMAAWLMIGFPGAYASYYELVDRHGIKVEHPPTSLAEDVHGHVYVNPDLPARVP